MIVKFWGARGSIPTPTRPEVVRKKISSVLMRAKPADLASPDAREAFLDRLPSWLFGTVGGNTSCIEITLADGTTVIIDAGSGIGALSADLKRRVEAPRTFHVLFSHFHYDHVQGLPFFAPAYDPRCSVTFYSPLGDLEKILKSHMVHPYFPITMDEKMSKSLVYQTVTERVFTIGSARVSWLELNHPGRAFGYRFEENGKVFVYASDTELRDHDFDKTEENASFYGNADVMVLDTQYTLGEAIEKFNWGHSSFSLGVDFATTWNTKELYLYHHEPLYDDQRLFRNLRSARWYARRLGNTELAVYLAEEGAEVQL